MYLKSVLYSWLPVEPPPVLHGYLAETLDRGVLAPFSTKKIKTWGGGGMVETGLSKMLMTFCN